MNPLGRAAVLVLCSVLLAACGEKTSSGSAAADETTPTSTPTEVPSPSATASAAPGVLTLEGVAPGAPPSVPYLTVTGSGASLVRPGGDAQPLPRAYDSFAPMGDGLVGTASVDDQARSYVLDADLEEVSQGTNPSGTLAATPDGAIVGWVTTEGRPHVVERDGSQEWDLSVVDEAGSVAALVSDGDTCQEGPDGSGCVAFVNSVEGTSARYTSSHGIVDTVPGVLAVGDVSAEGDLVGMTSVSDEGSCWGRFDGGKQQPLWETCDHTLFDFSPSGTRILAGPAYLDGFGQGSATVLDDEGAVVAEWRSAGQAALLHTIWEDDDHVLALVFQDDAWAILRLDVTDGSVELAVEPVPDQGGRTPFVLPVR
ncbi:MAG TPA: hypothetical protein VFU25_06645 [Ornithinibacter sp.]|nr:hypothetical protein [Ornithinibacter sp.]